MYHFSEKFRRSSSRNWGGGDAKTGRGAETLSPIASAATGRGLSTSSWPGWFLGRAAFEATGPGRAGFKA